MLRAHRAAASVSPYPSIGGVYGGDVDCRCSGAPGDESPDGLPDAIEASGFIGLPVTLTDADVAAALPGHHRDPFDRMLVAQAMRLGAIVVTRDDAFRPYGIAILIA